MSSTTYDKIGVAVRNALLIGASIPFIFSAANAAEQESERVIVTGSRIVKEEFSSSSPISVFNEEDIAAAGVTSVDEFLKNIPSFSGFQLGASTNNGNDGQKKVDMRGLGFNRTLVLINSRRQIGDVNGDGAVDLNSIPLGLIKRIEVLKDGASTIYGTDAMAGVVNIILKSDFEGFEFSAVGGVGLREKDAFNRAYSFVGGMSGDRGNLTMALEFNHQGEMLQKDRAWAHDALYPLLQDDGTFLATASGSSNSRRIRGINGLPGNYIVDETTGVAREFGPGDVYNYAPVNALITPNDRWQFGAFGNFQLIPNKLNSFMEMLYTKRTSHQRLAPDASFGVTASYNGIASGLPQWNDLVPASNPYNPFGDNAAGPDGVMNTADDLNAFGVSGESVRINRRFEESGGRIFRQAADTFRMVMGIDGELTDFVSWDFSYTYAQNELLNETKNYHRFDRWEIAVTPSLCNANTECAAAGVLNPFAPFGAITPEQMQFLSANSLKDSSFGELKMWQFNINGEGMSLPGGSLGWAIGLETRDESGFFVPDEFSAAGLTTGGASDAQSGAFSVDEFYGEVFAPVLDNLSVEASVRHSNYSTTAGSTTNYKLGFDWELSDSIRVRTGYATGFRAPNISELNQNNSTGFPVIEPLCEFADRRTDISDTIRQNCETYFNDFLGEPNMLGADGEYGFAWQSSYTTRAPDTPLTPEESNTFTIGAVFAPTSMEGLLFSFDYWNIEVDNWISSIPMNDLFYACMDSPGFSGEACTAFPAVTDATFAGIFPNAVGVPLTYIFPEDATGSFGNLGQVTMNGIDLELQYKTEVDWGFINKIDTRFGGTIYNSRKEKWPVVGERETIGTADGFAVYPELRLNTSVRVSGKDWSLTWDTNYVSETTDKWRPSEITDDNVAEAVWYHDLVSTFAYENYDLVFGINNIFDEDPSRFHSAFNANTEPGVYDVIGRRVFMQVKATF